jgi:DNA-binding LacI/PurR family transcriptional regulator
MPIDKRSFVPVYHQLKAIILEQIKNMELKEKDRVPSEHELCTKYQVSRTPVRQAIRELVSEGFIYTEPGRGTFVASSVNKRLVIALLVYGFTEESYRRRGSVFGELIRGVTYVTSERQVLFNVLHFGVDIDLISCLELLSDDRSFNGILIRIFGDVKNEHIAVLERRNLPYVVIKRHLEDRKINSVISDDKKGAFLATEHLILGSHQRIGLIHGPLNVVIFRERLEGYKDALSKYGIEVDPSFTIEAHNSLEEDGYLCMRKLLELAEIPSAVFVTGDIMALGAYEAIKEKKLSIPEDVAVVGYDDLEFASRLTPSLTTVRTSYFEFGRKSVEFLLEMIASSSSVPKEIVIEPTLIVRESSRKVRLGK